MPGPARGATQTRRVMEPNVCTHARTRVSMYACMHACVLGHLWSWSSILTMLRARDVTTLLVVGSRNGKSSVKRHCLSGGRDLPCPPNLALGSGRTAAAGLGTCCRPVGSWKIGTWSLRVSVGTWGMRSTDKGLALNHMRVCMYACMQVCM